MNERFKFRAWNKKNKQYIYDIQDVGCCFSIKCNEECFGDFFNDEYEIEQCTGLRDKNCKLIYEGDIIAKGSFIYKVKYNLDGFVAYDKDNRPFSIYGLFTFKICFGGWPKEETENTIEVIGNIHENPELMEKAK